MKNRRIFTILIIILQIALISSSISTAYFKPDHDQITVSNRKILEFSKQFSKPDINEGKRYVNIYLEEANSFITNTSIYINY